MNVLTHWIFIEDRIYSAGVAWNVDDIQTIYLDRFDDQVFNQKLLLAALKIVEEKVCGQLTHHISNRERVRRNHFLFHRFYFGL